MKKYSMLFVLLCLVGTSIAQKAKFEKIGRLKVEKPPKHMTLQEFSNYNMKITVPNNDGMLRSNVRSAIQANAFGFNYVAEGGEFTIECNVVDFSFGTPSQKSNTKTNKDGSKSTSYHYEGKYQYNIEMHVWSNTDEQLFTQTATGSETYKSKAGSNPGQAKGNWNSGSRNATLKLCQDKVAGLMQQVGDNFFFRPVHHDIYGFHIKPKKYEYTEFNAAYADYKKAITLYKKNNSPTEETKKLLTSVVAIWEKEIATIDLEDNKARINSKNGGQIYYELGMAYLMLGEYEKSHTHLKRSLEEFKHQCFGHGDWVDEVADMKDRSGNVNTKEKVVKPPKPVVTHFKAGAPKTKKDELRVFLRNIPPSQSDQVSYDKIVKMEIPDDVKKSAGVGGALIGKRYDLALLMIENGYPASKDLTDMFRTPFSDGPKNGQTISSRRYSDDDLISYMTKFMDKGMIPSTATASMLKQKKYSDKVVEFVIAKLSPEDQKIAYTDLLKSEYYNVKGANIPRMEQLMSDHDLKLDQAWFFWSVITDLELLKFSEKHGLDIHAKQNGINAVLKAAGAGQLECFEYLLSKGVEHCGKASNGKDGLGLAKSGLDRNVKYQKGNRVDAFNTIIERYKVLKKDC